MQEQMTLFSGTAFVTPPENDEAALDCPVLKKKITVVECWGHCERGFDAVSDEESAICDLICEKCRYYED